MEPARAETVLRGAIHATTNAYSCMARCQIADGVLPGDRARLSEVAGGSTQRTGDLDMDSHMNMRRGAHAWATGHTTRIPSLCNGLSIGIAITAPLTTRITRTHSASFDRAPFSVQTRPHCSSWGGWRGVGERESVTAHRLVAPRARRFVAQRTPSRWRCNASPRDDPVAGQPRALSACVPAAEGEHIPSRGPPCATSPSCLARGCPRCQACGRSSP
eukprot:4222887-Prymnesium_polylepis.1